MYCKHCGKEIDDNSTFCQHCGKKLVETKKVVIEFTKPNLDGAKDGIAKIQNGLANYDYKGLFSKQIFTMSIKAKFVEKLLDGLGILLAIDASFLGLVLFASIFNKVDGLEELLVIGGILIGCIIVIVLLSYVYHIIRYKNNGR